jgi:hypothetical protein
MRTRLIVVSAVAVSLLAAEHAIAQELDLKISNGVVQLNANNVTVDEILARWTATTGLLVTSKSGRGSDIPVTLQLSGASERDALATILRDLSGYIMGERRDPRTGVVTIDRLLILPESAPQLPTEANTPVNQRRGAIQPLGPDAASAPEPDGNEAREDVEPAPMPRRTPPRASSPGPVVPQAPEPQPISPNVFGLPTNAPANGNAFVSPPPGVQIPATPPDVVELGAFVEGGGQVEPPAPPPAPAAAAAPPTGTQSPQPPGATAIQENPFGATIGLPAGAIAPVPASGPPVSPSEVQGQRGAK